jgi:hypothetical protein
MLARLLAVADHVDAGVLLFLEGKDGGVALRIVEGRPFCAPGCPQLVGLGEPGRLRQAAGYGGLEHGYAPPSGLLRRAGRAALLSAKS